jgi:hypothetical protein
LQAEREQEKKKKLVGRRRKPPPPPEISYVPKNPNPSTIHINTYALLLNGVSKAKKKEEEKTCRMREEI